jgi:hypothetical protein
MLGIYMFQRFLNKLDDYKFENTWQNKILTKQRFYWFAAAIYYFVAVGIINRLLLFNNDSLFLGILVTIFVLFVYGSYFGRSLLKFIAINNQRFILLKSGFNDETFDNGGFSKDNVVG